MWARFDEWVAKRFFAPIIIWICQRIGRSQYWFSINTFMLGMMVLVADGVLKMDLFLTIFWGLMFLACCWVYVYIGEQPRMPIRLARLIGWIGLMMPVSLTLMGLYLLGQSALDNNLASLFMWITYLFSHYALLIDRIPPREDKRREVAHGFG